MSQSDIEKIKERLGIKEVVETYIKLEKSGKNYKGRCPFHNEKTPSFFVSPDRDSYYCFGCGEKGDIFSFIQKMESLDFYDALKSLASRAGVEISKKPENDSQSSNKKIKEILEVSTKFFEQKIKQNSEALKYLSGRGLSEETISNWRIGFASDGWSDLLTYLKSRKYSENLIMSSGMIKKNDKGSIYDTFRSRIMFPIFNSNGEVIAFSGRIFSKIDSTVAKYLNSPETELFKKSEILYGFNFAKQHIRKNDFTILVEGQMDTVMCHQAGYKNTVASSGTALSEKQLEIIYRISPNIVIAYDSDSAGFKAAEKAWQMALNMGFDIKIAPIDEGNDPADIIKSDPQKWKMIIKNSSHIIEVLIKNKKSTKSDGRQNAKYVSEKIIPYLASLRSNIEQSHFIKMVNENFGIREDAIYEELQKHKSNSIEKINYPTVAKKNNDSAKIEKRIFGILIWQESAKEKIIDPEKLKKNLMEILNGEYDLIYQSVKKNSEEVIFMLEDYYDEKRLKKEIDELLVNLKKEYLKRRNKKLLLKLRSLEKTSNDKETDIVLAEIGRVSKEIEDINKKINLI
ncbi:MAG TPA: DNA primase [Candidatus Paceibacterota bacterium]|nr:DNA primase [Candidatus Paceibacterota bacterium]